MAATQSISANRGTRDNGAVSTPRPTVGRDALRVRDKIAVFVPHSNNRPGKSRTTRGAR